MASTLTNNALKIALNRMFKETPDYAAPTVFKVGRNQTTAQQSDTDLDDPVPISGSELVDDCETADFSDSTDMTSSLNTDRFKEGSSGLNLIKDGTSGASASISKTVTSRNFTSKELSVWIYLTADGLAAMATSSCLTIRYGSDNSNYYEWVKDKADLAEGWNLISGLTSSNADSTTGSPTITACDYFFLQLTATGSGITWSEGDVVLDEIKVISSDDYLKEFDIGYPIIDETTNQVTIRGTLSSTEANGYNINGFAIFNEDSSPLMVSIDDFTTESKTNTDELIFTVKNRIRHDTP